MGLGALLRSIVPPRSRAALRRVAIVNKALSRFYGGVRSCPHPHAPYRLYFDGYRNIGWSLGGLDQLEVPEMRFAEEVLRRKTPQCVWDVGANVGLWTLFLAGIEPPIPAIVSFEPDPANQRLLRLNVERNRLDRVTVRELALSSQPGQTTFYADTLTGSTGGLEKSEFFIEKHYGAVPQEVQVRVSTVDAEIAAGTPPPQFMKIDVEGHEHPLLLGAQECLTRHRPMLLVEVTRNHDAVRTMLNDLGYQLLDPATGQPQAEPGYSTACVHRDDQAIIESVRAAHVL